MCVRACVHACLFMLRVSVQGYRGRCGRGLEDSGPHRALVLRRQWVGKGDVGCRSLTAGVGRPSWVSEKD